MFGAGFFASAKVLSAQEMQMSGDMPGMNMKGKKGSIHDHGSPVLVETPDVPNLPWRMDGNVKEFQLQRQRSGANHSSYQGRSRSHHCG